MVPLASFDVDLVDLVITVLIPAIAAGVVFFYQKINHNQNNFIRLTSDLHSENKINQITSAILLRTFLSKSRYRKETLNVIVALLRVLPNGNLQKTLADCLTYVPEAKGQDFQNVNLHYGLIKPQSYIDFELNKNPELLNDRISFVGTDFYESYITSASIHSVDFTNATMSGVLLCGTTFRNCIFKGVMFKNADMNGCKFIDCVLDKTDFSGARRVSTITLKNCRADGKTIDSANLKDDALVEFLVDNGLMKKKPATTGERVKYKIFFSRLGKMDARQQYLFDSIKYHLKTNYPGLEVVTIERSSYREAGQLTMIKDNMDICCGAVIFAFSYMRVQDGVIHEFVSGEDKKSAKNCAFPSPWIQIETAFASAKSLPCLIVTEAGLKCDGIFDEKVLRNDPLMFTLPYDGSITSDAENIISSWWRKVEKINGI